MIFFCFCVIVGIQSKATDSYWFCLELYMVYVYYILGFSVCSEQQIQTAELQ